MTQGMRGGVGLTTKTGTLMLTIAALAMLALLGGCKDGGNTENATVDAPPADFEAPPEIAEIEPAKAAPEFTVPLVAGGDASLSDYEGKILVLDFWATFCVGCVAELPEYQELYASWDSEKVAYLGMSLDGNASTVDAFLKSRPEITLPMAVAPEAVVDLFLEKNTLPSSRVIDASGMVRYEFRGPGAAKVKEAVRRLLEEQE